MPIDFGRLKGTVIKRVEFERMVQAFYEMNGWDKNGIPLPATLYDYQLEWAIPYLSPQKI